MAVVQFNVAPRVCIAPASPCSGPAPLPALIAEVTGEVACSRISSHQRPMRIPRTPLHGLSMPGGTCEAAARACQRVQVVDADQGLMPPLSWKAAVRSPEDAFFSTERLHCLDVLRMKATTVALILESKCGPEAFLSIVRSMLQAALASRASLTAPAEAADGTAATQGAAAPGAPPWRLNAAAFLKQVAQVGGFRREVNSFAERWIYGSGCPRIRGVLHPVIGVGGCPWIRASETDVHGSPKRYPCLNLRRVSH